MASQKLLVLGRVLGAWGLRGAVKVQSFADPPALVPPGRSVILRGRRGESEVRVETIRPLRHLFVATFQGIDNREAAEAVRGYEICVPRASAPPLPEASYYQDDILGLTVQAETGEELGEIVDIWPSHAHDLYVVRRGAGEWLLPAVQAFILQVDLARRVMVVRPIEGLVDAETV
ncbi:MAG: ribosome maturation factor RimM [Candidatus Methylomirabilales bacterium]